MREIKVQEITAAVSKLCKDSCYYLPEELLEKLKSIYRHRRISFGAGNIDDYR